jgi:hypothetical protein
LYKKFLCFFITFLGQSSVYGQLVGGAAVKAEFWVEADAYANLLKFGNLSGPSNTDDWFNTYQPGNGENVIFKQQHCTEKCSFG